MNMTQTCCWSKGYQTSKLLWKRFLSYILDTCNPDSEPIHLYKESRIFGMTMLNSYLGGGFKDFEFSPRSLGKRFPFWRAYFSKGVGSTTNYCSSMEFLFQAPWSLLPSHRIEQVAMPTIPYIFDAGSIIPLTLACILKRDDHWISSP